MMTITNEYREKVKDALLAIRPNFDGSDGAFAKQWNMHGSIWNRIKNGRVDGLLADGHWMDMGRELGVGVTEKKWNTARTEVFAQIEEDVTFCQEYAKAMIYVDDCEIGKTHTAKYLSRNRKNCFYLDCSQAKTKQKFIRKLAKVVGVDHVGTFDNVKENIKYYLKILPKPIVIVDEAGDLEYPAFLELKEFWNATEGSCGWYMIGADGLRAKIEKGIANMRVGYRELFSRFSSKYSSSVPSGKQEKVLFYRKLIGDVLSVNMDDATKINEIVKKCITLDKEGHIGGLRRAESILLLAD
jgi:hypothetical protein